MKTISKYCSIACIAILAGVATGCTSDEILSNNNPADDQLIKMDTIRITMGTPDTRVAYDDAELKATWEAGDQIKIVATSNGQTWTGSDYTLVGTGGSATGTFAGQALEGMMYIAVYPKSLYTVINGVLNVEFDNNSQTQDGDNTTAHLKNYMFFSARGQSLNSLTSFGINSTILKFHFTNLPAELGELSTITWKSSIEDVFRVKVERPMGSGLATITKSSSQTLRLTNITVSDADREVTAYMAIDNSGGVSDKPKLTTGSTIRAIVTGTNGKYYYAEATVTSEIIYEPGHRYTAEMDGTNPMPWTELTD